MGRRTEVRIAKRVPVLVHGTNSHGSPFTITAHVQNISGSGAHLSGLNGVGLPGTKLDIEFQGRKARYRIQWVGKEGTPQESQVGLRCLEPGNFIWGVRLPEWAEDKFEPAPEDFAGHAPAIAASTGEVPPSRERVEQRHFPRQPCRIETLLAIEGTSLDFPAKITDISLGGCYVEMLSPLPVNALVELELSPGDITFQVHGKVVTSQMGMGMGVAFTSIAPEDFEKLRKLAPPAVASPAPATARPAPAPVPAHQGTASPPRTAAANPPAAPGMPQLRKPTTSDALEAVVRVLFRKGILSRSELTEELEKLLISKS